MPYVATDTGSSPIATGVTLCKLPDQQCCLAKAVAARTSQQVDDWLQDAAVEHCSLDLRAAVHQIAQCTHCFIMCQVILHCNTWALNSCSWVTFSKSVFCSAASHQVQKTEVNCLDGSRV